ncbi:MAG: hypothetical protein BWY31_00118 [Lentisphaerae bacterium ADurb.Bin242]|nr:MAG: hypothetical protein BWY31_00118 [Lentisphaerae bacterium ADurb.Bin242]
MLCQNCKKNEATIHVQQIVEGQEKSFHLCPACAAKKAETEPELQSFNLAEMLFDLADKVASTVGKEDSAAGKNMVCPHCGWDMERFRKTGYLGCPECYKTFSSFLSGVLKNMHRGCSHEGKTPCPAMNSRPSKEIAALRHELTNLRKELALRVKNEEYEEAAQIRDKIQSLTVKLEENEKK